MNALTSAQQFLKFNPDEARKLFERLDHIHLVAILPDAPKTTMPHGKYFGTDIDAALRWAANANGNGWGVYWTLNYVGPSVGTKPSKKDIQAARGAHCDIDPPKDGSAWDKGEVIGALTEHNVPPSLIIDSGNGVQPVWLLDSAARDWAEIEAANIGIRDKFKGDPHCHNIDRLLRVPGSVNYPNKAKRDSGRVPCMASWVQDDTGQRYQPTDLAAAFPPVKRKNNDKNTNNGSGLKSKNGERLAAIKRGDNWHDNMLRLTASLTRQGLSTDVILTMADGLTLPGYTVEETLADMREMIASARRNLGHAEPQDDDSGEEKFDPETGEVSLGQRDEGRRENQRRENQEIGEGTNVVPTAKILTLDDMVDDYVFILQGSQVAPLSCPQSVLALQDFKNAMAGSKHWVRPEDSKPKALPVVSCWLEHQDRKEADTITFRAGGDLIIAAPNSNRPALNMWSPFKRPAAPADWESLAEPFVEHVRWLWGQDADKFLDWLAHIEQFPGVLPHYGWVHISRQHGKGRNWISSVLARVWRGYVAASLDLVAMLEGKFNGRLSRKILAIVDEINEGGNASYRHAQTLRQLVTAEHREINPKYGKQHVEYNSCRWLLFSNHAGAIPLTEDDRRFWVVSHDGDAKPPAYYSKLYGALADPAFIASVTEFLRRRNIDGFMPGERPPMNEAKAALVAVGQNEDHLTLKEVSDKWPVDLITNYEIAGLLEGGGSVTASVRLTLSDLDFRRIEQKVKVWGQGPQRVYAIRNHAYWTAATHEARKTEIDRIAEGDKREAIGRGL